MTHDVDLMSMQRALRLAALGRHASPNPMVGAVIVDQSGRKVGEGYHPEPGQPHAEIFALREAGTLARGATAYVTLEPCSHYGRTPPCADALVDAGVGRVVIASLDPDNRVSGRGIAKLRDAGIAVDVGLLQSQADTLNAAYNYHRTNGIPWITVKIATTLDGKTATIIGDSKWITSGITRRWVHRQLRDRSDAIMVGVGTILKDNPSLTTRLTHKAGRNPYRIVVDSNLRTPLHSNVVLQSEIDGKTIIFCLARKTHNDPLEFEAHGVKVIEIDSDENGRPDLRLLVNELGTHGNILSVLLEGGSTLIASAIELGIVKRYITTVAPKLIGGAKAPGAIGGGGVASTMEYAQSLSSWRVRRSATDLVIDARLD